MLSINHTKNDITISYSFKDTERKYTYPDTFAGFIGILAETGYTLSSAGSSFVSGTSFPSVAHNNGESIDLAYIGSLYVKNASTAKDQNIIDAAKKFHFISRIAGSKTTDEKENAYINRADHNGHLHIGGVKINDS